MPRVPTLLFVLFVVASAWHSQGPAHPDATHSVTFAVRTRPEAASTCDSFLSLVSDPESPHYGNHKSLAEVNDLFLDYERVARVEQWLSDRGLSFETMGDYIKVTDRVEGLNALLDADFETFTHPTVSGVFFNTEAHSVPAEISEDIEMVLNVSLPTMHRSGASFRAKPQFFARDTPSILKNFYKIGNRTVEHATQGVYGSGSENFSPSDLLKFQTQYNLPKIPMKVLFGNNHPNNPTGEATLDVQYMLGTAWSKNTYYSAHGSGFEQWLIDLSNMQNPPQVNSISYFYLTRNGRSTFTMQKRFNLEACKLGLRGVTIVSASGDFGANFKDSCDLVTQFPAECPYVTAVGATQGPEVNQPEIGCDKATRGTITSGGGFSWIYDRPSFQEAAVVNYLKTASGLPTSKSWNKGGRGYPDVAVLGTGYNIIIGGRDQGEAGTSASAPVFAAMLTLVNEQLILQGKPTVGFVNPALYKAPAGVFNDITKGRNNWSGLGCQDGYSAAKGWDPVTGLGSPNMDRLIEYFTRGIQSGGGIPTQSPTHAPTQAPTHAPTQAPTHAPTQAPTHAPTRQTDPPAPTRVPTVPAGTQPSDPSKCSCNSSEELNNLQQNVQDLRNRIATIQKALNQLSKGQLKSVLQDILGRLD